MSLEFRLAGTDGGDLWVREDTEQLESVIHLLERVRALGVEPMGVAGSDFSLLDGQVNDVEWAGNIARSKDVRVIGLLSGLGDDFFSGKLEMGVGKSQGIGIGHAAEAYQELLGD